MSVLFPQRVFFIRTPVRDVDGSVVICASDGRTAHDVGLCRFLCPRLSEGHAALTLACQFSSSHAHITVILSQCPLPSGESEPATALVQHGVNTLAHLARRFRAKYDSPAPVTKIPVSIHGAVTLRDHMSHGCTLASIMHAVLLLCSIIDPPASCRLLPYPPFAEPSSRSGAPPIMQNALCRDIYRATLVCPPAGCRYATPSCHLPSLFCTRPRDAQKPSRDPGQKQEHESRV